MYVRSVWIESTVLHIRLDNIGAPLMNDNMIAPLVKDNEVAPFVNDNIVALLVKDTVVAPLVNDNMVALLVNDNIVAANDPFFLASMVRPQRNQLMSKSSNRRFTRMPILHRLVIRQVNGYASHSLVGAHYVGPTYKKCRPLRKFFQYR